MSDAVRIQVLLPKGEADRFDAYCRKKGFKKSPLIARLIREHLDQDAFQSQRSLFDEDDHRR